MLKLICYSNLNIRGILKYCVIFTILDTSLLFSTVFLNINIKYKEKRSEFQVQHYHPLVESLIQDSALNLYHSYIYI